jgi:hypothetical protein
MKIFNGFKRRLITFSILQLFSTILFSKVVFYENFEKGRQTKYAARTYYKNFGDYCNGHITTNSAFNCTGQSNFPNTVNTDVSPKGKGFFLMHGTYYSPDNTLGQVWGTIQSIPIEINSEYIFSFYIANVYPQNPAKIKPSINGEIVGQPISASGFGNKSWIKYNFRWNSGNATTAQLSLENMTDNAIGNDFCLDDIKLEKKILVFADNNLFHDLKYFCESIISCAMLIFC